MKYPRAQGRPYWLPGVAALVLAGCGGGGSGDSGGPLTVSVSYSGEAYLLTPSLISPQLSGFEGHTPRCSLASGHLPDGMSMNSNCSISGTPRESGGFDFVAHVEASGVSNSLDISGHVTVFGPSVLYEIDSGWLFGSEVDISPLNSIFWNAPPNVTATYKVVSGMLPPGVVLDPVTGRLHGTVSGLGQYRFRLGVQVSANGVSSAPVARAQEADNVVSCGFPASFYPSSVVAVLGSSTDFAPSWQGPAGATYEFSATNITSPGTPLPEGITLDAATGRLAGRPLKEQAQQQFAIKVKVTHNGIESEETLSAVAIEARSPVVVFYGQVFNWTGTQVRWLPSIDRNGVPSRDGTSTYTYAINPATPLPPGLSIESTSGAIVGSTPNPVEGRFFIDVHVEQDDGGKFDLTVPIDIRLIA